MTNYKLGLFPPGNTPEDRILVKRSENAAAAAAYATTSTEVWGSLVRDVKKMLEPGLTDDAFHRWETATILGREMKDALSSAEAPDLPAKFNATVRMQELDNAVNSGLAAICHRYPFRKDVQNAVEDLQNLYQSDNGGPADPGRWNMRGPARS